MISLGLSAAEERLFNQSLTSPHQVDFRVKALDLSHNLIEDLSDRFIDGQVNVNTDNDVTRDASVSLFSKTLFSFEANALSTGAAFAQILISIEYGVFSPLLPKWVWVPVFVGQVTQFQRTDDDVSITCSGKEQLLLTASTWRGHTYPKGFRKVDLIRDVLSTHGENRLDIPEWPTKINRAVVMSPNDMVWPFAKSMASSWGAGTLMYDGRGYCRLFNPASNVRWTFKDGDGGSITTEPDVTYSLGSDEFVNAARIYGPAPAKGKKQIFSEYVAPATHPLSPQGLARAGSPTYYVHVDRDSDVATQAAADKMAKDAVNDGLAGAIEASFSAVPVPHLEPWDMVALRTRKYNVNFRAKSFSIPLNVANAMTVGYNAKVSNWRKRGRKSL